MPTWPGSGNSGAGFTAQTQHGAAIRQARTHDSSRTEIARGFISLLHARNTANQYESGSDEMRRDNSRDVPSANWTKLQRTQAFCIQCTSSYIGVHARRSLSAMQVLTVGAEAVQALTADLAA